MALSHFLRSLMLLAVIAFCSPSLFAQQGLRLSKVDVKKLEINEQKTPEFNLTGGKGKKAPRSREWLEIDVEFEVEGSSKASNDYIDELTFKYYVVLDDPKKTMITATVNHTNVPMNEEVWSSVYIAPSTIEKIAGKSSASSNLIAGVAVEILHAGQTKGGESKGPRGKWWEGRPAVAGLLLPKSKTPFKFLWWDRYAEEKPTN